MLMVSADNNQPTKGFYSWGRLFYKTLYEWTAATRKTNQENNWGLPISECFYINQWWDDTCSTVIWHYWAAAFPKHDRACKIVGMKYRK